MMSDPAYAGPWAYRGMVLPERAYLARRSEIIDQTRFGHLVTPGYIPLQTTFYFEDDARERYAYWWYFRCQETGVLIGVKNPRPEPDEIGYSIEWDARVIAERADPSTHRDMTDFECDAYGDGVNDVLRSMDYSD